MRELQPGLTNPEIQRIVNRYIGVRGSFFNGFSHSTLAEFYPAYCEVDIDADEYGGPLRSKFADILRDSRPAIQAKILRGMLERFPEPLASVPVPMTPDDVWRLIRRLEGLPVETPDLLDSRSVIDIALRDANDAVARGRAASAVDRVHTALHGYLQDLCKQATITHDVDASAAALLRQLRTKHPRLRDLGEWSDEVGRVLMSMGSAVDALGTLRNKAAVSHPNDNLLDEPEAMLVINATRTILGYLDARIGRQSR